VWPNTTVQTSLVHLIRNSIKYCSWKDRRAVIKTLKPIYQAATVEAATDALDAFEVEWGDQYPAIVDLWRRNWERFTPFLGFDAPIRKVIYTTNAIESLNYQLRKVTKTRGHFPTEQAVLKILYLAIRNIGNTRGGELGTNTPGWKKALNAFAITFPGRLDPTT
jgi:putative transposase